MSLTIFLDSREKARAIKKIVAEFDGIDEELPFN